MAEFFLFLSLTSLVLLLFFEPFTLRVRFGDSLVIGIHLSVFALLLSPQKEARKGATPPRASSNKEKMSPGKRMRRLANGATLLSAGFSALHHYADRPSVRIFTLAPKEEPLPDRAALAHGRYAVLLSILSLVLHGFFPHTRTDADALSQDGATRFDFMFSVSLSDLFLMVLFALRERHKFNGRERI